MADEFEPVHDEYEPVADDFEPVKSPPLAPGESQDQGPPTAPGMKLAPTPADEKAYRRDLLKRISERNAREAGNKVAAAALGVTNTVPFAKQTGALFSAAADKGAAALGWRPDQPFADLYRDRRDNIDRVSDALHEEEPTAFNVGRVGGAVGQIGAASLLPGGAAAKGWQLAKQGAIQGGLSGLSSSKSDLTKGEIGGAAIDTGIGAGLGAGLGAATSWLAPKVVGGLKNPYAKGKEALGEAMQWPQKAYEAVAERVGRTGMAQKSGSVASDVSGPLASANVKALRTIRDNADLGSELASSLRSAAENLGGTGNKLVSQMTQEERAQVAKAMADLLQTRGLKDVTPEFVASNMDSLAQSAGLELDNLTGNNFLRMANKRDPQWWVSAGEGVRKFWTPPGMAGEAIDPRLQQQFAGNRDLAGDFAVGKLDRMGRPMSDAGPGKYQFGVDDMEGKLAGQDAAMERIKARASERLATSPDQITTTPGMRIGQGATPPAPTFEQQVPGFMADVRDHRIAQGYNPAAQGKTIDELFPTLGPAAQSRDAASAALRRLQNVATGRNFLADKALPLAGALAGGASAPAGMGVLGMLTGAPIGAGAASKLPVMADALGELGQGLAQGGRDAIKQSALRAAGDPQKIRSLAQVPGAVGDAARRALEVAKDPAAFAARSYMLSLMPEFRQMLAGDDASRASP